MRPLKLFDIVRATDGVLLSGNGDTEIRSVLTDSRKIEQGCLFVPLIGERFDGHDFLNDVLENGAAAVLTMRKEAVKPTDRAVILVEDSLRALQKIAELYRTKFSIPVIGLTGSVGKTTTKEMTAAVMGQKYNTLKTEGNFNNEIGLPLTVFRLEETHQAAVLEMGMSGFGEIERLSAIVKPELAMMTNIGMSHIELLGSQENIYRAKSEILHNVTAGGTVLINGDDPILCAHRAEMPHTVYSVGTNADCDAQALNIRSDTESVDFVFDGFGHQFAVHLNLPGEHNVYNALFACSAGVLYGVPDADIVRAMAEFCPTKMRMDKIEHAGFTIINDCYNAAPASMEAALRVLGNYEGKKIAVLGDIACLGDYSYEAHRGVGAAVVANRIDELFTVGEQAHYIAEGAFESGMDSSMIHSYDTVETLLSGLSASLEQDAVVLVKASRVMELERVTEFLLKNFS